MKNIKLLALSLFSLAQTAFAQENPWMISAQLIPTSGFRTLSYSGSDPTAQLVLDQRESAEEPGIGLGGGLQIRRIHKRWIFATGLNYNSYSYRRKAMPVFYADTPPANGSVQFSQRYNYNYISVPLEATWIFKKTERSRFGISLSAQPSFLLAFNTTSIQTMTDGSVNRSTTNTTSGPGYKVDSFNLMTDLGFAWYRNLNDKWGLFFQPALSYGWLHFTDRVVHENLYAFKIGVGATYQLAN